MNWNRKRIEADADDARSRGQGGAYVGLKDGESMEGRFMPVANPGKGEDAELYVRYGQHYLRDIETYFTCLDEGVAREYIPADWKCPFCRLWKELRGSKDSDDQEEAKKYNMSTKFLSNFRLASGDMRIFRYSVKTQPKLVDLAFGTEYADVLELTDGRDVRITRKGSKLDTEYSITPLKKTYSIEKSAYDDLHDLYAEIKVLSPDKMELVLKGAEPDDDDLVSVRDLMDGGSAAKPAGKPAPKPAPAAGKGESKPSLVKKKGAEPAPPAEQDDDADRKPTKGEAKMFSKFGDEIGIEIDMDNPVKDITDAIVTEAIGHPKKKLSADFLEWLELNGCDVSGPSSKLVERAAKSPSDDRDDGDSGAGGDDDQSEVQRQIQKIRDKRNAGKK